MLEIQLYINEQRLDLFKDESISLTDSIQNVKDIDKIFTAFSKSFSLPASKTNSKIFKHFYNFDIDQDFAFDARVKTPANIEINSMPFRRGYIKLEGVDLKDNIPYSYRVTFFGEIVKLKDAIGESKLSDLTNLGDVVYNENQIYQLFIKNPETLSVDEIVPLITHTQRLYYDSNSNEHDSGNLAPQSGNKHGVKWNELKPAMRLNRIIEAIEETFPVLEFTDDFFKNTTNEKFNNLFMWLSRKSGAVENLSADIEVTTRAPFPSGTSPYGFFGSNNGVIYIPYVSWNDITAWDYQLYTNGTQPPYTVSVRDSFNQLVYQSTGNTGDVFIYNYDLNIPYQTTGIYLKLEITASQQIDFNYISWNGEYMGSGQNYDAWTRSTGAFLTDADFLFEYSKQMPDMTILNFLSGLFRMFNLTAFVQDDGKIKVQPLDEYYNDNFVYRDITEYVGIEKSSVNAALPYRQVKFDFSDTKSFLANKFGEINNKAWGLLQYNNGQNDLTGSLYKVTAPFGHFLFERLTDAGTNLEKNIQWGWSVDRSQNAMLPKPLLFYPVRPYSRTPIQWVNLVDPETNEALSDTTVTPGSLPFNSVSDDATQDEFQLNFTQEVSEWTGDTSFTETLFTPYTKYIQSIFNPKQRLTKVEVMLPIADFLQIKMNDRIIIRNHYYRINSITTNLSTGKSELELLNEFN